MRTLRVAELRDSLLTRIDRLRPDAQPRWGRQTVAEMICHLADQLRMALGDIPTRPIPTPLLFTPFKQFGIYIMPWPKGRVRSPREARTTRPAGWKEDCAALRSLLERFAVQDFTRRWPPHPYFGRMSGRHWLWVTRRHFDHHLRQFGV